MPLPQRHSASCCLLSFLFLAIVAALFSVIRRFASGYSKNAFPCRKRSQIGGSMRKAAWFLDYVADPVGDVAQAGALTFGPLVVPFAVLDTIQGACGLIIVAVSVSLRVPFGEVVRMLARILFDWALGSLGLVPVLGWFSIPFDFLFRPNVKNAAILSAHVAHKNKSLISEASQGIGP
jgi:hypothetical protein